jgi:hypothetical protein
MSDLFDCPGCKTPAFTNKDKYLAAKWKVLVCPHCGKRVISQPLLLAGYYLLYLADIIDFSFLAYMTGNLYYLVAMVVVWGLLDLFSIYLPLAAMRDAEPEQRRASPPESGDALPGMQQAVAARTP